jgi:hypothetical protein
MVLVYGNVAHVSITIYSHNPSDTNGPRFQCIYLLKIVKLYLG